MERPRQQTRLEQRQGLTIRACLSWEVWFSIGMTQEQCVLRGHSLWSLWSGSAGPSEDVLKLGGWAGGLLYYGHLVTD